MSETIQQTRDLSGSKLAWWPRSDVRIMSSSTVIVISPPAMRAVVAASEEIEIHPDSELAIRIAEARKNYEQGNYYRLR